MKEKCYIALGSVIGLICGGIFFLVLVYNRLFLFFMFRNFYIVLGNKKFCFCRSILLILGDINFC